jgi:hypothetical protein
LICDYFTSPKNQFSTSKIVEKARERPPILGFRVHVFLANTIKQIC